MKNFYLTIFLLVSLLIPRTMEAQDKTVWGILQSDPNTLALSFLLASNPDAVALLDGPGPVTVFAPSSAAIAAIPQDQIAALLADTTGATAALVNYHLVPDTVYASHLADGVMIPTLQGGSITVSMTDAGFSVDEIPIIVADLIGTNGAVHVIGGLLSPPAAPVAPMTVDITFFIDANNIEVAEDGMFISGAFNEWGDTPMIDNGDGTWYATFALEPGTEVEYKFKNGTDGWEEDIVGDCVNGFGNRALTVPAESQSLGLVSFNACEVVATQPPAIATVDITFVVDASQIEVAEGGMLIAGAFNEWMDGPMMDNEDGTWSTTVALEPGMDIEYKFKNGADVWEDGIEGDCVNGFGNRILTVPAESQSLSTVFFNSCEEVVALPPVAVTVDITFVVDASQIEVADGGILVAGAFNEWADGPMMDNGDGTWSTTVALEPGTEVEYKFKNGADVWEDGIEGDCVNGFGNRFLVVPSESQSLSTVFFNSCEIAPPPGPVVVDTSSVTFVVDMSKDTVDAEGMFLAGSFTNWENVAMTDNGDGTWSYTGMFGEGDFLTYKFKNGPNGWEANEVRSCSVEGTLGDRGHTVGGADEVLSPVCFNSCAPCFLEVTLVVDASQIEVAEGGMLIAGAFNEWSDQAMTDNGDSTWSVTLTLSPGDEIEYKFKNGADIWEDGIAGACVNGFGNRLLIVPEMSGSLAAVCFNSCVGCNQVNLTVSVDMNQVSIAPEGVFIAGAFNGWTDGAMTDNGDGTYTTTVAVDKNAEIEYKFKNGPDGWEDGIEGDCVNGFGNRIVTTTEEDVTMGLVCFNACAACTEPMVTFTVDMSEVEVAAEGVFIAGAFNEFADMPMTDNGDGTWSVTMPLGARQSYEYKFKNGPDGWEEVTGACTVGFSGNREVVVVNDDLVVPTVCFSSCVGCGLVGVSFNVDMSQEKVDEGGVRVAGSFSEWTDVLLTDVGNGIWSGVIGVMPNDTIEFKYKNGADGWEENVEGECAAANGNRSMIIADIDASVMQTCFNSCDICVDEPDPDPIGLTSLIVENSCLNDDGTVTIRFAYQYGCETAPGNLSGMDEIGFHSGVNNWQNVVAWDDEGAATAVNVGDDVFEVTIDPVAYYGLGSIEEFENITMVFNQGPAFPDAPWDSEGKAKDGAGIGGLDASCDDIILYASELRNCSDIGGGAETASTGALLNAGTCLNDDGTVSIAFDVVDNCMEAPGSLAGLAEIGFHSGANDWSSVVEWNGEGATTAVNDGNDRFIVTLDPTAYYGVDVSNIWFVLNQGPAFPDAPWDSEGKAQGDGACVDFNVTFSELPSCPINIAETQDLPLTFESDNVEYQLFGFGEAIATRIDNPDPSGNGSGKVLSIEKTVGAETWAGVAMPVATTIDLANSSLMYAQVWSPRAGVPFLLKIEDTNSASDANGNPSIIAEVTVATTVANAWETLVFDMSMHPDFNPANSYNQVVVFADMNNTGTGETFYVDNIATQNLSTNTTDLALEKEFEIAPNPFNNQARVSWNNPDNEMYQIHILNITGQVIRSYRQVSGENLLLTKDNLLPGMYFLNIQDDLGNTGTLKLMID